MKLKGYIKALKENCFAIPIYSDGTSYFYHNINNDFKILGFEKTEISEEYFIKIYLSKTFDLNTTAALIFVGSENYLLYNSADEVIDEVFFYLNDSTENNEYLNIKKEAKELQKTIIKNKKTKELHDIKFVYDEVKVDTFLDSMAKNYSLEEYLQIENSLKQNKTLFDFKEKIIKTKIENSILDNNLFKENKEVIFLLLNNYLSDNKSILEQLIINTNIGKSFTSYLSTKSESYTPMELSIEQTLKLRAEERRIKLKDFNYQFHDNISRINELEREPAYKRFGIDVSAIPDSYNPSISKFILFIDDKMISEEIKQEEIKKMERQKINK